MIPVLNGLKDRVLSLFRGPGLTLFDPLIFVGGLVANSLLKRTPRVAARSMRRLFVATDGRLNDAVARASSIMHPPQTIAGVTGVLGRLGPREVDEIADEIRREGFARLGTVVDAEVCERIVDYSLKTPASLLPKPVDAPDESIYDRVKPVAARYEFEESRILDLPELQKLATDETLMAIAQAYLRCAPINDLVAMWWSPATGVAPSSQAAQLFHFDMDRFKFLKFFVYLTDVDSGSGPHVYVRRSHVRKPKELRRDGRIPDEEILAHYGEDAIVEITGRRGTVLAVDTRGFHKGKAPETNDRLLFQIEYANSLFGVPYNRIVADPAWSDAAMKRLGDYPRAFARFESPAERH